jgi:protein-disulfide isomerase
VNSVSTGKGFDILASVATSVAAVTVITAVGINWLRAAPSKEPAAPVNVYGQELALSDHASGLKTADVAVVEFSDFQCPFCGRFARDIHPDVVRTLVETGSVVYDFRSFPLESLHGLAFGASKAAECAGQQGQFWTMYDRLFATPQQLAEQDLVAHAAGLSLEAPRFRSCLERAGPRVQADASEGQRLGVTATPTFMIGVNQRNNRIKILYRLTGLQTLAQITHAVESVAGRT